ncbi:MAG TPA: type I methionyl aminopeptidase [Solirubrobacteraceae bacterium]|nr:type I methionyl aminopeptidase [Solirubrobacteraceae bacterium]
MKLGLDHRASTPTNGIDIKTPAEIEGIAGAGAIAVDTLRALERELRPGVTTAELDAIAHRHITSCGATPTCKGYRGYPASICASPNHLVVHGIPGPYALKSGDLITLDLAVTHDGWIADTARTFVVGPPTDQTRALLATTEAALAAGVERCLPGGHLGDISHAVQQVAETAGFTVLRELRGHGVGRQLHEPPMIANYGVPGTGPRLVSGMVLALEPMISAGSPWIRRSADGWSVFCADDALTAHYEFTVAITDGGPRVLTPW